MTFKKNHRHNAVQVLIADDNEILRNLLRFMLERKGYQVDSACDGVEAVEHLHQKPYDLLITDVVMPKIDGIELIRYIRELNMPMAILCMSGQHMIHRLPSLNAALLLGADAVIMKPFRQQQLYDAVEQLTHGPADSIAAQRLEELAAVI